MKNKLRKKTDLSNKADNLSVKSCWMNIVPLLNSGIIYLCAITSGCL